MKMFLMFLWILMEMLYLLLKFQQILKLKQEGNALYVDAIYTF